MCLNPSVRVIVWEDPYRRNPRNEGQVMAVTLGMDLQRLPVHGLLSILHVGSPFTRLHGTRRDALATSEHSQQGGVGRGDGEEAL